MGIAEDFGKSAGKKVVVDRLKALMAKYNVPADLQRMLVFAVDNSVEYVDLCIKTRKKPDDPKVLTEFLVSKGVFTAKMASADLACVTGATSSPTWSRTGAMSSASGGRAPMSSCATVQTRRTSRDFAPTC